MNTPHFGVPIIVNYGNGGSTNGAPPAIDHRVYVGMSSNLGAPGFSAPRLAIIERLTPRTLNATKSIDNVRSRGMVLVTIDGRRFVRNIAANARSIRLGVMKAARL